MAKKGNDTNNIQSRDEDTERRVPRDAPKANNDSDQNPLAPPPEAKTDEQEAADAEKAAQVHQRDDTTQAGKSPRQTYGIARRPDGGVFLNIGSEELDLTEDEWLTLVAKASAGRDDGDRVPALRDFHRSEGDVGFVTK